MPELPEVETVRLGLLPVLEGHVLTDVETRRGDLRLPFPKDFVARTKGRKVKTLRRRAKYLLADLDSGERTRSWASMIPGRSCIRSLRPRGVNLRTRDRRSFGSVVRATSPRFSRNSM